VAKPGDEYQELVGAVAAALDPGASVKMGQWIEGPDGKRDLDVEVRGTIDGSPCFILIECKDWRDRVGIGVIDALDSKRRDLGADRAIAYSNSGFTAPALRKAARLEIGAASALKAGDGKAKVAIETEIIAKRLSVDSMRVKLNGISGKALDELEDGWIVGELLFDNSPVINWISELSRRLIEQHENATSIVFRCTFRQSSLWSYQGRLLPVGAIGLLFSCSKKWLSQVVRVDVTLGLFDHLRRRVTVPNQQAYFIGWINRDAWVETDKAWEETELEPGTFEIYLTLFNHIRPEPNSATPKLEELIAEREVLVDSTM